MRALIAVLLSVLLSLNTAYAAVLGVCDTFEHGSPHELTAEQVSHFGHHSHADEDRAAADNGDTTVQADHCHAHPSFSSLTIGDLTTPAVLGRSPFVGLPPAALVSALPIPLDNPPRGALA